MTRSHERHGTAGDGGGSQRLAVHDLVVDRGEREVLKGVSFDVRRGEAFGLLGPNGAGKSTAFHVLTGLLPPRSGRIDFEGEAMRPGDRRLRRATGVVFQEPALDPRLSARANLRLAARLNGVPRADVADKIDAGLSETGLRDRADEAVQTFSGGMRRRLDIARALLHDPRLVVLDEPTSGLDERAFRATWDVLDRLRERRGVSLIVTTHRPDEAERCDRLAVLDAGRIVACDSPDALRAAVHGDLVVVEADAPDRASARIAQALGLEARVLDGKVVLELDGAHAWVPRIVEALPDGAVRAVSVRRAGLGEVFLELTGHELGDDAPADRGAA